MKFLLKKQTAMITSCAIFHYHYPISSYANTSSRCEDVLVLYKFIKFAHLLKQNWGLLKQKIIKERSSANQDSRIVDWAPLIKASSSIEIIGCTNHENQTDKCYDNLLNGKTILCVGGKIKLYTEYNQIVKNSGGTFISFHGDSNDTLDNLFLLMEKKADMIICPVDCVNHTVFQTIKYYCKSSGKPCVLLDRSAINSFTVGVRMLALMIAEKTDKIKH
ncbi:uncharacterized protein DUF2325 [Nitrosomonas ureae]|uniref:DUF2325 domain-containing protein n=1 Tax=Nitrosomonas ureae TaxID=44577 RepID=UPI000D7720C7|nr:DUF2325 domain-containing protein [Nitrosomonas ureae]PXX11431.1 uncharacterized protein DUF2325 [Nitrosomonas ureae]